MLMAFFIFSKIGLIFKCKKNGSHTENHLNFIMKELLLQRSKLIFAVNLLDGILLTTNNARWKLPQKRIVVGCYNYGAPRNANLQ